MAYETREKIEEMLQKVLVAMFSISFTEIKYKQWLFCYVKSKVVLNRFSSLEPTVAPSLWRKCAFVCMNYFLIKLRPLCFKEIKIYIKLKR